MSGSCRSLLFFLHRCVAARHATVSTGALPAIAARRSVSTAGCGFVQLRQQRQWVSRGPACLQSLCRLQALRVGQHSLCTKAGTPDEDEYPPLPAYNPDSEPEKEVYIVQVRGLPWSCKAEDLLQFFSECRIRDGVKGVHLTLNRMGKPSGLAFIEMEHEEDVSKALEKHMQYLGPRYVEVYEITNSDAEAILKKSIQVPAAGGVVRLRGLPFSCTEADIVHFFQGLDIVEDGVTIVLDRRGRNSGEAYVRFSSQEEADKALQRDREVMGNRYIEVFPSRGNEIHSSWRRTETSSPAAGPLSTPRRSVSAPHTRAGSHQSPVPPLHQVHMRGLPFQATAEDIVQFFSPLAISKILIEYGPDGRASGEADVFFTNHQNAADAMSKDKLLMGERYIELFLNSAPDTNER
ncbi:G-rich sequence factor 1 [Myripristis murdjan]|uniref:G-rich RNA sequence binding factor 1 n=1 Tax=Myripristis murdjan TaxID=586833 RepID=A0A667X1S5_9TELE|nr:G-rich sequence factor 1-like [Myripristis murdjan]